MNRKLKLNLIRLQARASRIHGIARGDFLKLTPSEFAKIEEDYAEEWKLDKEVSDRQTARILLAIYKTSPKHKNVNKTEDDFLPKSKETSKFQTGEEMLAIFESFDNQRK